MLKSDVAGLKDDVGVLKNDVAGLKDDVGVLKNDVAGLKDGQKALEKRQEAFEKRQEALESRQGSFEEGQRRIEKKLDAVYDQVADLTEFKIEITQKIDSLIEDNRSIHEILGEHEISIRTLRRKPV